MMAPDRTVMRKGPHLASCHSNSRNYSLTPAQLPRIWLAVIIVCLHSHVLHLQANLSQICNSRKRHWPCPKLQRDGDLQEGRESVLETIAGIELCHYQDKNRRGYLPQAPSRIHNLFLLQSIDCTKKICPCVQKGPFTAFSMLFHMHRQK